MIPPIHDFHSLCIRCQVTSKRLFSGSLYKHNAQYAENVCAEPHKQVKIGMQHSRYAKLKIMGAN